MTYDRLEARWRKQKQRARQKAVRIVAGETIRPRGKPRPKLRPFMGVDGEGAGSNRHGQQHYMLLRIGERELYTGSPLTTRECLEFILQTPPEPLLVGYGFGYDATQIIRGIYDPADPDRYKNRLDFLFKPKASGQPGSRYMRWNDYGIEYLPKQYLRVSRQERYRVTDPVSGTTRIGFRTVKGSCRTIYETVGFFQTSFLSALRKWNVGLRHHMEIEKNKAARNSFVRMTNAIRHYNKLECELLAELMENFRAVCFAADLRPATWSGAGKLAAWMHKQHHTITAHEVNKRTPSDVLRLANHAYYGGRFEVPYVGDISGPIYEYDRNSAYPTAMRDLPCLLHGGWIKQNRAQLSRCKGLYVARVRFWHPAGGMLCGLPIRQKNGRLFWPRQGEGVYWSTEIRSAERLGAKIEYIEGWRYDQRCTCHAFDWIEGVYAYRKSLADMRGEPIKLGLNSLYGKLAQRVGNPRYGNLIWAGLTTASVRASLNDAAAQNPSAILMFATDALFSLTPLQLDCGAGLGQWEALQHERIFICQPGLYWGAKRPKTRGIPSESFLAEHVPAFEAAWRKWIKEVSKERSKEASKEGSKKAGLANSLPSLPPSVRVPVRMFIGLRLAHSWGRPEMAGRWAMIGEDGKEESKQAKKPGKEFSFRWDGKRSATGAEMHGVMVRTLPASGLDEYGRPLVSLPHKGNQALIDDFDALRLVYDEQPDHVTASIGLNK